MAHRLPKKSGNDSDASDFRFHLVGRKSSVSSSSAVIGAIVAGPASVLLSGVLGTGSASADGAKLLKIDPQPSKLAKPAVKEVPSKTKPRRRSCG
jgi:hypothetical protein